VPCCLWEPAGHVTCDDCYAKHGAKDGGKTDGGTDLVNKICTDYLSLPAKYCGKTASYQAGLDCRGFRLGTPTTCYNASQDDCKGCVDNVIPTPPGHPPETNFACQVLDVALKEQGIDKFGGGKTRIPQCMYNPTMKGNITDEGGKVCCSTTADCNGQECNSLKQCVPSTPGSSWPVWKIILVVLGGIIVAVVCIVKCGENWGIGAAKVDAALAATTAAGAAKVDAAAAVAAKAATTAAGAAAT
jgi:hypothetical protein